MQKKYLTKSHTHSQILSKLGAEGILYKLIKNIYIKPTANVILDSEKLDRIVHLQSYSLV